MTAPVLPVIPPASHEGRRHPRVRRFLPGRAALSLPQLTEVTPRVRASVYGLTAVDASGRIAAHQPIAALGWSAGTRLEIRDRDGVIVFAHEPGGGLCMTQPGQVRLPASIRNSYRLGPGAQLLVSADPDLDGLLVCPLPAVDAMITWLLGDRFGGEIP